MFQGADVLFVRVQMKEDLAAIMFAVGVWYARITQRKEPASAE